MATQWLRRTWLLAACASALLLAACGGGGSIDSQLVPSRVIAFGDATADVGQGGTRYTVNDNGVNVWTLYAANAFGQPLAPSAAGGLGFATGNARITTLPDAAGGSAATVQAQVDAFLASAAFDANDLVLVSAGTSDVIAEGQAVIEGRITEDQALVNVDRAARDLGAQVRRLVNAGARHVVIAGVRNLGVTPWALETGRAALLESLSSVSARTGENEPRAFNDRLKIEIADLGASVLYVETASYFMLVANNPGSNGLDNTTGYACASVDAGGGIGTGPNQVNSALCTPSTLQPAVADYNRWLFADRVYLTPRGQQLLGELMVNQIRERW
ncbi:MAG TPA: SGNH/GDSL hydrolase family protein [Ramlibacter sp.]